MHRMLAKRQTRFAVTAAEAVLNPYRDPGRLPFVICSLHVFVDIVGSVIPLFDEPRASQIVQCHNHRPEEYQARLACP